jgi:hypothetical protein
MAQLLDQVAVRGGGQTRSIEIYHGDLTELDDSLQVDALIVSAFPGDYRPVKGTLIGALDRKGVSVADLAKDKAVDLRANYSCWLSKEVRSSDPGIRFRRILCFEPRRRGRPPELVADIFRSLAPYVFAPPEIRSIALPLVACGDQRTPVEDMLDPLLDAATHWLSAGLPIDRVCIVESSEQSARKLLAAFQSMKAKYARSGSESGVVGHRMSYDVFLSYSRKNSDAADFLVADLKDRRSGIRVFLDRSEIPPGASWNRRMFEAIDQAHRFVPLYSPDYLASNPCLDELDTAHTRRLTYDNEFIFPILLYEAPLPSYMLARQAVNCSPGDRKRLHEAVDALLVSIDNPPTVPTQGSV